MQNPAQQIHSVQEKWNNMKRIQETKLFFHLKKKKGTQQQHKGNLNTKVIFLNSKISS